jgi:hypothetical protein
LTNAPGDLGLGCTAAGLTLAGTPLLRKTEAGFVVRSPAEIEALVEAACPNRPFQTRQLAGLAKVAEALNGGDIARAMIAAVLLRLPELDFLGAVRVARMNDALSKYDPNEPRDRRGRWTTDDSDTTTPPIPNSAGSHAGGPDVGEATVMPVSYQPQTTPTNLKAVDFAIGQVGDGIGSRYGFVGRNDEVRGRHQRELHGQWAAKCNIFVHDAYDAAGAAPALANGRMPVAKDWYDVKTSISAGNRGRFEVVAKGDLSKIDPKLLQSGDVISNGEHVGLYVPIVYAGDGANVSGYSKGQIRNGGVTPGKILVEPRTISAAATTLGNFFSPSRTQPFLGGVTWNNWGFRGDANDRDVVVRRLITPAARKKPATDRTSPV